MYDYLDVLLKLAAYTNPHPPPLPTFMCNITTPLNLDAWELWLNCHPNQNYASYILSGISRGFRIGFDYSTHTCTSFKRNHPSARECPTVISETLAKEVTAGRLIGPLEPSDFHFIHVSSLGAVPKKHVQNKWRLILDLSHPAGRSVNDGISKSLCSLSYTKVDNIVRKILTKGKGTLLAKRVLSEMSLYIPMTGIC